MQPVSRTRQDQDDLDGRIDACRQQRQRDQAEDHHRDDQPDQRDIRPAARLDHPHLRRQGREDQQYQPSDQDGHGDLPEHLTAVLSVGERVSLVGFFDRSVIHQRLF